MCVQAVVGAGAAGLVAARELRREGHEVVVFEQQPQLGGTWLYTDEVRCGFAVLLATRLIIPNTHSCVLPQVESDLSGRDPKRRRVHSSMYQGLTTNLPREIMGFSDFPFSTAVMMGSGRSSIDGRRFPCSEEVSRCCCRHTVFL
jgi:cation diffusion facilitator CzcD-associated flavoprotein CzcO